MDCIFKQMFWTSVGGVLLGLVGMKVFGFLWLDPVIAIIVALIIFRAGYKNGSR